MTPKRAFFITFLTSLALTGTGAYLVAAGIVTPYRVLTLTVLLMSIILISQGLFTLIWMLYAWENPKEAKKHASPATYIPPALSFTALVPARNEETVLGDTIRAVANIRYPERLKETIVLIREDDMPTIRAAQAAIGSLNLPNVTLRIFGGETINKPFALNLGLRYASGDVIAVFDAEDEPNAELYHIVNTVMHTERADVIQSGVQLMNYRSTWFSVFGVLEYFFWFKSGLHFFTNIGKVTPLGGNTVFAKRQWLREVDGWDDTCLTEDADLGIRLTAKGARTRVIYDERHVTQEETAPTTMECLRQRTRWNQGFIQIFKKGTWRTLTDSQKVTALYVLLSPALQAVLTLSVPFAVYIAFTQKLPIATSILSFFPFSLLMLQLLLYIVGLREFTAAYRLPFNVTDIVRVLVFFYPYQMLLMFSSFRAFARELTGVAAWEKTLHVNAHRKLAAAETY